MKQHFLCMMAMAATGSSIAFSAYGSNTPTGNDESGKVQTFTVNGVSFDMVYVQGSTFIMGRTEQHIGDYTDEYPAHPVSLSDFSIGKLEVTQQLWHAVMGQQLAKAGVEWDTIYGLGDSYPAYYVDYDDVQEFIAKLNAATGKTFRLPTEAEWEYAARGGSKSKGYKYSGSNTAKRVAWFRSSIPSSKIKAVGGGAQPVGTKAPNELGIHDMNGNVWEWCSDWFGDYPATAQINPTGAGVGFRRIIRGGSWYDREWRVNSRHCIVPDAEYTVGFRLVLP